MKKTLNILKTLLLTLSVMFFACGGGNEIDPELGDINGKGEAGKQMQLEADWEKLRGWEGLSWEVSCPSHPCVVEVRIAANPPLSLGAESPLGLMMQQGPGSSTGRDVWPDNELITVIMPLPQMDGPQRLRLAASPWYEGPVITSTFEIKYTVLNDPSRVLDRQFSLKRNLMVIRQSADDPRVEDLQIEGNIAGVDIDWTAEPTGAADGPFSLQPTWVGNIWSLCDAAGISCDEDESCVGSTSVWQYDLRCEPEAPAAFTPCDYGDGNNFRQCTPKHGRACGPSSPGWQFCGYPDGSSTPSWHECKEISPDDQAYMARNMFEVEILDLFGCSEAMCTASTESCVVDVKMAAPVTGLSWQLKDLLTDPVAEMVGPDNDLTVTAAGEVIGYCENVEPLNGMILFGTNDPVISLSCNPKVTWGGDSGPTFPDTTPLGAFLYLEPAECMPDCADKADGESDGCGGVCEIDRCGDGVCSSQESCSTCEPDCGKCP